MRFELDGDEVKLRPAPSTIRTSYGAIIPKTDAAIRDERSEREAFEQAVADEVAEELAAER